MVPNMTYYQVSVETLSERALAVIRVLGVIVLYTLHEFLKNVTVPMYETKK